MDQQPIYETPMIVYEGDLEIQAGSPLSVITDLATGHFFRKAVD
jgi:hypothetical protein